MRTRMPGAPFNRTVVELKQYDAAHQFEQEFTFNRTVVELKHKMRLAKDTDLTDLLIVLS